MPWGSTLGGSELPPIRFEVQWFRLLAEAQSVQGSCLRQKHNWPICFLPISDLCFLLGKRACAFS